VTRPRSLTSRTSPYRTVLAFLLAPIVAAGAWYLLRLAHLGFANGGLHWRTDVVALLLGALLVGIPLAGVVTWVAGAPAYLALRRLGWLRAPVVVAAGAVLGLVASGLVLWRTGDLSLLHPFVAVIVGIVTAACWWWMAGAPSAGGKPPFDDIRSDR